MILEVEAGPALFVLLKLLPAYFKQLPVLFRCQMCTFFKTCRSVSCKCKNINFIFNNEIDNPG